VTLAGPGSEEEEDLGAAVTRDDMSLVWLERHESPGPGFEALTAGLDSGRALEDDDERILLHLVIAELLAGIEADEDGSRLRRGVEDDRRTAAVRRLDLG
jgi:hypothetical protein